MAQHGGSEIGYHGDDGWPLFAVELGARERPTVVLMHGGGPDHRSLLPLARNLADGYHVVLPDVRGYGRSVCPDPSRHTWSRYAEDVIALLDHLGVQRAFVGGAGLGSTIALRVAAGYPHRLHGAVLISIEDIEDDERKQEEIAFMDAFAERVRTQGIEAAWAPILPELAPVIGAMVREAIPRMDPASIAAAAAIGRDRSFRSVEELASVEVPTLIFRGMDARHPPALAENLARTLSRGVLAEVGMSSQIDTIEAFGAAFAPSIRAFADLWSAHGSSPSTHAS
ncbi:MAG: alpha/beta fold hydrolase [Gammaproteobacteria bacterium]|nr:alpha/beta fold hydrolase [Gammaproteobacteria bacterium]